MNRNWEEFLAPYHQAVGELKVKLRGMRSQFEMHSEHSPIEFVTGRVKSVPSIIDKAEKRNVPLDKLREEMQDIAGLRMMCQFVEDIKMVVALLRKRNDFEIVEERDYVTQKKDSGYRSYHVVVRYPVQTIQGEMKVLVEIQIRTLAMNFWATIEHSLNYKYRGRFPADIKIRLQRAAEAAYLLDEEMSSIRIEIQEAQKVFLRKTETQDSE
ncbi:GTP pyrophosphokinase family protein [Bacillus sp. 165]|uniref:GTP pyrophosphokinase n=1 Tax=Bacillus sp. 165 TaxID=1529117 RepID=UPI001ADCCBBB|nr:GTP pyrophosphokinase family protein [Bacillus sp. 165]MBO9128636.1 GTP pyrophosphokinase family protein [Bacillus sp. 165]